ncbi:hypothetical protein [Cupriavidus basilensis]|uniref:aspartate-alanine antiporter-like transporter n=1 Tax=Cupriavidus basilensis TaxID=68895 RepID=UPI00030CAFDA
METIVHLLATQPEIALFLALAVGHAVGAVKVGPFQFGGICGTLIAALVIGQSGARIDTDVRNVFFALFIFALGFTGGPQFFANVARSWRIGLLSVVEVAVVLALMALAVVVLNLDQGTAAGLLAGGSPASWRHCYCASTCASRPRRCGIGSVASPIWASASTARCRAWWDA